MALTTDLVAYYKLDSNANDSVSTNNLTISGASATVSGKINGAYDFDGSNDYLYRNAFSALGKAGTYSYSLWFYANTIDAVQILLKNNLASDDRNIIGLSASGDICVGYYDGTTTRKKSLGSSINANTWYHIVFVKSGTTVTGYLNATAMTGSTGPQYSTETGFALGGRQDSSYYFDGIIDEVGLWSRALTSEEVTKLYNSGFGLQYPFNKTIKNLTETFGISDTNKKSLIRAYLETFSMTESLSKIKKIIYAFTENFGITEATTRKFTKTFTETFNLAETFIKKITKNLIETFGLTGSVISDLFKLYKENFSITETLKIYLNGVSTIWRKGTKPSSTWTEGTKPSTSWTNEDNINK